MRSSTPDLCGAPLSETVTGLQRTTVHRGNSGVDYWWWHRPGLRQSKPVALAPLAGFLPDPGQASPGIGAAVLSVGQPHLDGLLHWAPGPKSAATWLRDFRPAARILVANAITSAGHTLHTLHGRWPAETGNGSTASPGLVRLHQWLAGTTRGTGPERLHAAATPRWGEYRLRLLNGWAKDAADAAGEPVLVHGWASLGALVPAQHPGPAALLTGEDLGTGRPELDLGWMLGDLAELAWRMPHLDLQDPTCAALARGFVTSYGSSFDRAAAARCAVLRIVTHMQDYASYQPWTDELLEYIDFVAVLIDDEGRSCVPEEEQ